MIPGYSFTRVLSTNAKRTRGCGCHGHPAFPTPSLGERFIIGSGALRGEAANVCLMNASTPHSQSSSPAKEPVKDTDLILRSLRSKRLEGWTQRRDSRPSFETRARRAPQDEVGDAIVVAGRRRYALIAHPIGFSPASICARRGSRNGGSASFSPSVSKGSSVAKPGPSVAISYRMPLGSRKYRLRK